MEYNRSVTTITAPAASPIDLNAGRPDWRELGPLFGLTLAALLPVLAGGVIVVAAWPEAGRLSGWSLLFVGFGGLLAFAGISWFWSLRSAVLAGVTRYQARIDDWHYATLERYQDSDGQITATQVDERYWYPTRVPDMLLLFLYVWMSGKTPTVRALCDGPLMLSAGPRSFVVGRMTQDGAEAALQLMARAGLIIDRQPRHAGKLALLDPRKAALALLTELARDPRVLGGQDDARV